MKDKEKVILSAIKAFFTLSAASMMIMSVQVLADGTESTNATSEKCYGIVKAGMNDCATATQSCAGSAIKNKQPDAFIFLPPNLCDKIAGGTLAPINPPDEKTKN